MNAAYTDAFDAAMAVAGMTVPEAWRAGTLASFVELRQLAALVHDVERPVEHEPAGAYRMSTADLGGRRE